MIVWILRTLFVLGGTAVAYSVGIAMGASWWLGLAIGFPGSIAMVVGEWKLSRTRISVISSIVFGVLVGLLMTILAEKVVVLAAGELPRQYSRSFSLSLLVVFSYLAIAFIYQTRNKFRFIVPYAEFRPEQKTPRTVLLDTSVIIDGRIAELLQSPILEAPIVVHPLVLDELHKIADSDDPGKRQRGRFGIDTLEKLKDKAQPEVRFPDWQPETWRPVDEQLIAAARKTNARIMTNDYNLNRLATLEGIDVINLNELSNALKPIVLTDETINIKLTKKGERSGQAVGYLDDGTMVVVDDAAHRIGEEVSVVVTNTLTRETGRMIFAELYSNRNSDSPQKSSSHGRRRASKQN